jgi:hypothetical protein
MPNISVSVLPVWVSAVAMPLSAGLMRRSRRPNLGHQVDRQLPERLPRDVARPHAAQQNSRGISSQLRGFARGDELGEQHMQPVDGLSAGALTGSSRCPTTARSATIASSMLVERKPAALSAAAATEIA